MIVCYALWANKGTSVTGKQGIWKLELMNSVLGAGNQGN